MSSRENSPRIPLLEQITREKIIKLLDIHAWHSEIIEKSDAHDYLVIKLSRANIVHHIATVYSTAISNPIYRSLDSKVEAIFARDLYRVESYAHGIKASLHRMDDFIDVLVKWNAELTDGNLVSDDQVKPASSYPYPRKYQILQSESPIRRIWSWIHSLSSAGLARKLLAERFQRETITANVAAHIHDKAEGLAFSIRNASEYYSLDARQNLSQRILNLYYGTMAFVAAEMLSSGAGPRNLSEFEEMTKGGHGLYTVDGPESSTPEDLVIIGVLNKGLFKHWMDFLGNDTSTYTKSSKKPETFGDLPKIDKSLYVTIGELFSRIPEIEDAFLSVTSSIPPSHFRISYNHAANGSRLAQPSSRQTYVALHDASGRMNIGQISRFPYPLTQIQYLHEAGLDDPFDSDLPGNKYLALVDHPDHEIWHAALPIHSSPFWDSHIIMPLFGEKFEYRAIVTALLYGLSILVRYRPSIWRRILEGPWDEYRYLIEQFIDVVERVLPQEFLQKITGIKVIANQPDPW